MMIKLQKLNVNDLKKLKTDSKSVRRDILKMIHNAGTGSPGSALSCVEILVWLLRYKMNIKISQPRWHLRDRLVLSKGHSVPVFYSICSKIGWIDKKELLGFRLFNTRLQTHPEYNSIEGIDYPSGSLGQGLSAAIGMAIGAKYQSNKKSKFFVLMGDGELQEGQIWEAAMMAGHYKLSNIIGIIDNNKFSQDDLTEITLTIEPLIDKWESFGWEVIEANGHEFHSLESAFNNFKTDKPKLIIANTVKGKGVSFMENNNEWHMAGKKFTDNILKKALAEI